MGNVFSTEANSATISSDFQQISNQSSGTVKLSQGSSSCVEPAFAGTVRSLSKKTKFLCGWRLKGNPDIEVRISKSFQEVFYSLYDTLNQNYLENGTQSPVRSDFIQCIWKDCSGAVESRLFKDGEESSTAILVSVSLTPLKIKHHILENFPKNVLKDYEPNILINEGVPELKSDWIKRKEKIFTWYEPQAEEGMIREKTDNKKPYLEKVVKVWNTSHEIRLIQRTFQQLEKEDLVVKAFDRKHHQGIPIQVRLEDKEGIRPCKILPIDHLPKIQLKTLPILELTSAGTPQLATFYQTDENNPVLRFMKGQDLSLVPKETVENWVQSQFCYRDGVRYEGNIEAKKIKCALPTRTNLDLKKSSDTEKTNQGFKVTHSTRVTVNPLMNEEEHWEVILSRRAGVVLQVPVALKGFFLSLFSEKSSSEYRLLEIDQPRMKEFIAGVPMSTEERDQAVRDFNLALANCSTVTFRISCARTYCGIEVNQRFWVLFNATSGGMIRDIAYRFANIFSRGIPPKTFEFVETTVETISKGMEIYQKVERIYNKSTKKAEK